MNGLKQIEEKRAAFVPFYKTQEKVERILFTVGLLIILFGWLVLPSIWVDGGTPMKVLQACLMLIPAAALIIYALLCKKVINERAQDFFKTFYKRTNEYVFDQPGCTDLVFQEPSNLPKEKFDECLLFSNIVKLNSKAYATFNFNKLAVEIADVAALTKKEKSMTASFTGKFISAEASYKGKDRVVIYLKGKGVVLPPTNLDDLKSVFENDQMIVWSNAKDWKKLIPAKAQKLISNFKTNKLLIDMSITILNGKQYVCMGYDDPLMLPPFENEYDPKPTEQYKKEIREVLSIMEELA